LIDEQFTILHPSRSNSPMILAKKIEEYIRANFTQKLTLDGLSGIFNVSSYYLSHIFKEKTGESPINYLINQRIKEAEKLLLATDMPVYEIAGRVGYENANQFFLPFKKVTKCTPEEYRKRYQHNLLVYSEDEYIKIHSYN
jgi:YesN/AraC family two-component response regulator